MFNLKSYMPNSKLSIEIETENGDLAGRFNAQGFSSCAIGLCPRSYCVTQARAIYILFHVETESRKDSNKRHTCIHEKKTAPSITIVYCARAQVIGEKNHLILSSEKHSSSIHYIDPMMVESTQKG